MPAYLNVKNAKLIISAVRSEQFPSGDEAEFVFAGKSNVGKSSLINAMLCRKSLARSSKQPGKTRTINFYAVEYSIDIKDEPDGYIPNESERIICSPVSLVSGNHSQGGGLRFVDLPGYGFAKVSRSISQEWGAMIENYLIGRTNIKTLYILLDIRHEPNSNDKMLYEWCLAKKIPVGLIATKADRIKKSQVGRRVSEIKKDLGCMETPHMFSSESKTGRNALWAGIIDMINPDMIYS